MNIAVCDDDKSFLSELKNKIYEYSNLHNWDTAIDTYENGNDLINSEKKYNLIILDYQMNGIDGLETARFLRNSINKLTCIIFLTSYPEIAISAYEVDTYRFILKSTLYDGLFKALDDFRNHKNDDYDISVKSEGEFITINTRDIVYIEVVNKDVYIYLNSNKVIHTKKNLTKIFNELPTTHFFRVHKGYVINFSYIDSRDNSSVKMDIFNIKIPISRNYLSKFKDAYCIYLKDYR